MSDQARKPTHFAGATDSHCSAQDSAAGTGKARSRTEKTGVGRYRRSEVPLGGCLAAFLCADTKFQTDDFDARSESLPIP
jgi:hypothetical protein